MLSAPSKHSRHGRVALVVGLTLGLVAWLSPAGHAELIRLADGSVLQAEIVTFDDRTVTLQRLDNGGEVRLRWSQLHADDRRRLRQELGLDLPVIEEAITARGDRIELMDGTVFEGRVDRDASTDTELVLRRMRNDAWRTHRIRRDQIADAFFNVTVDARSVLTSEQLYERLLETHPPVDPAGHFLIARYCRNLGLYERGLEHLLAIGDRPELAAVVEPMRQQFEELIAQAELRETLHEARALLDRGAFGDSLLIIDSVLGRDGLSEPIRELATRIRGELMEAASLEVGRRWMRAMDAAARQRIGRDTDVREVRTFAAGRRTLRTVADITAVEADPERAAALSMYDEIMVRLYRDFGLPLDTIEQLFEARDRSRIRPVRVRLPIVLLETFGYARTAGESRRTDRPSPQEMREIAELLGALTSEASDPRVRELIRRLRERPGDHADVRREFERLRRENRAAEAEGGNRNESGNERQSRSDLPADEARARFAWPNDIAAAPMAASVLPQVRLQDRNAPQPGDRAQDGSGTPATPEEIWARASVGHRRAYAIYLFCEAHRSIERIGDSETGAFMEYRFR